MSRQFARQYPIQDKELVFARILFFYSNDTIICGWLAFVFQSFACICIVLLLKVMSPSIHYQG